MSKRELIDLSKRWNYICVRYSKRGLSFYCKFDFDVWRRTGRRQKSNGRKNRPTPGILFSKHPVFHFAPMFRFAPTYYIYNSIRYWVSWLPCMYSPKLYHWLTARPGAFCIIRLPTLKSQWTLHSYKYGEMHVYLFIINVYACICIHTCVIYDIHICKDTHNAYV